MMAGKKDSRSAFARSTCPVACLLDVVGDKWTLLVVRDLLLGKTRYGEFLESPEGIPTNILADRLKRLLEERIVEKHAYQSRPERFEYLLTEKGHELGAVVKAAVRWGERHIVGTKAFAKKSEQKTR